MPGRVSGGCGGSGGLQEGGLVTLSLWRDSAVLYLQSLRDSCGSYLWVRWGGQV